MSEQILCAMCGLERGKGSYLKSQSPIFSKKNIPICKDCINRLYTEYKLKYKNERKAIQRVCMAFDIYWNDDVYLDCIKDDFPILAYIKKINTSQRGRTFDTSIDEGFVFSDNYVIDNEVEEENPIDPIMLTKWGVGFEPNDYKVMEDHFNELVSSNPKADNNQMMFVRDLCRTELLKVKTLQSGDVGNFQKASSTYNSLFNQAKLEVGGNLDDTANDTFGKWVSIISEYTPEEYYKDKKLYKDFDGIGDYFNRHILRPLKNLEYGTKDRDKKYKISDETEDSS